MTVHEVRIRPGGAPARVLYADLPERAGARGTVLFYHGLGASKEDHTKELASLAAAGFLAVGIDNHGHGERLDEELACVEPNDDPAYWARFVEAVHRTALEIPAVIEDLLDMGISHPSRIGVAGISMGGHISYAAPLAERRVQAIAPIVGRPRWYPETAASPHHFVEKFFPVAVLSQVGEHDTEVPPKDAKEFHERLDPTYDAAPHRLRLVEYAGAGHAFPGPQWDQAWDLVLAWFARFLRRETVVRGF